MEVQDVEVQDDELRKFEAEGAAPLPVADDQGYVEHDGARIWYGTYGAGSAVILLHGGLGHSGNWGYQVPPSLGVAIVPFRSTAAAMAGVRATIGHTLMS
jgi:hypothetical protein